MVLSYTMYDMFRPVQQAPQEALTWPLRAALVATRPEDICFEVVCPNAACTGKREARRRTNGVVQRGASL